MRLNAGPSPSTTPVAVPTLLLGALVAAGPLAMDIYLASMPSMPRALSTTPAQVQLTLSVYIFGWGIAQLFTGPVSDRFGRRPVVVATLALFVLASVGCALATTVEALIGARALQAVSLAGAAVVPRAIVRDLHSGVRAAQLLSLMGMVLGIAPIVAPLIGAHLHGWFGWQANFVFVAVYAAIVCAWAAVALRETLAAPDPTALQPAVLFGNFLRALRSPAYRRFMAIGTSATCGLFAYLSGSAFVLVGAFGRSEREFGLWFGMVMLGNLVGSALAARWVRRLGIETMLARGSALMLASGALLLALSLAGIAHPLAVVVPMFGFMLAFMFTMPQATAGALTLFPGMAGNAASLLSFVQFAGAATMAEVVGIAYDGTSHALATGVAVASLAVFLAVRWRRPR